MLGAVFGAAVAVVEEECDGGHFGGEEDVGDAVADVGVGECVAGFDAVGLEEDLEDPLVICQYMLGLTAWVREDVLTVCTKSRKTISLKQSSFLPPRRADRIDFSVL